MRVGNAERLRKIRVAADEARNWDVLADCSFTVAACPASKSPVSWRRR